MPEPLDEILPPDVGPGASSASSAPPAPAPVVSPYSLIDQLIVWLIEHPGEPKKNAAKAFGVREQFIYTLTASDLFKAKLQQVLAEKGIGNSIADLHAKLAGLMEMSVDKLTAKLAETDDAKFIFEVATRLIATVRGAPSVVINQTANVQNNVAFQVDARTVAVDKARERMLSEARLQLASRPPPSVGEILVPSPFAHGDE